MKKTYTYFFLFISLLVFKASPNAFANAVSYADAWYDWSTFKVQVTYTPSGASEPITRDAEGANWDWNNPPGSPGSSGIDFFWYGKPTTPNADASNSLLETASSYPGPNWNWSEDYQAKAEVTNAIGLASVTGSGIIVSASGNPTSDGSTTTWAVASAAIHRSANIFSNIDALFTFSIDAYINHVMSRDNAAEGIWGYSELLFFLTVNDNYNYDSLLAKSHPTKSSTTDYYEKYPL